MAQSTVRLARLVLAALMLTATALQAQVPEWIWHSNNGQSATNNEVRYFRKTFNVEGNAKKAVLAVAADDEADVWVNGKRIMTATGWKSGSYADVKRDLKQGENVIAVRGVNQKGNAALLVRLMIDFSKRQQQFVVSDSSWLAGVEHETGFEKPDFKTGANWSPASSRGKLGIEPWGDVLKQPQATAAADLTISPGFKVELLRSAQLGEGSWICMTVDGKGRLIISPQQDDLHMLRITLAKGKISKIEPIPAPVHQAMGLCWSHDSLYANAHGPQGTGLYRLIDANHNDQFDANEVHFLKRVGGEGEHGYHALVEGPDKMVYMMNGNHTKLVDGIMPDSPHQHYQEDLLLPRQWDANGHAVGILSPGGHILRTDENGKTWELMLAGFRNTYDFDFNSDGEIFTYDSDMEWDWGLPWYRPTRIIHAITAGEYGWRSGSAKWPEYYPDSLPATYGIGIGCPTGIKFGTKSNFPEEYRRALFALDWSYGRLFAMHMKPHGASYEATPEVFIKGKPLNLTDIEFGKDGAMYFITGGRGTQSGLYRVTYVGKRDGFHETKEDRALEKAGKEARAIRHNLEAFAGKKDPAAVEVAWPFLGNEDRFISYAARIAIECQDVALWRDRAIAETNVDAGLNALLALARVGGKETQRDLLMALKKFPLNSLNTTQKLNKLRVIELSCARQGKPDPDIVKLATEKLDHIYPSDNLAMNRELCSLLVFLEAPDVVEKTFTLLDKAQTQEEQITYIFALRNLKTGWTVEQRKHYFDWFKQDHSKLAHPPELMRWFEEAGRDYGDGASFPGYLRNIRKDAVANLSDTERGELAAFILDKPTTGTSAKGAGNHKFVREWKLADLEAALDDASHGRNFEKGKQMFQDAQCILCHRFGNEGGAVGPDLTVVSSRFNRHDILESILEPSKVVSEQYQNTTIWKKDGDDVTGRVVDENDTKVVIQPNPLAPETRVEIKKSDIAQRSPSKVSPMPEGLLNIFTKDEILDLIAYVESSGRAGASNFKKETKAK